MINSLYKYHRTQGHSATCALGLARADVATNKTRYSSKAGYGTAGNAHAAYGESHCRWIENLAECGLRFVGYADEVGTGIEHTGWYTSDDNWTGETVRGCVLQMAGRNGKARFIAAYECPWNMNTYHATFDQIWENEGGDYYDQQDDTDAIRSAASVADGFAECMADETREHNRHWQAGRKYEDLAYEATTIRQDTLALIAECKAICADMCGKAPLAAQKLKGDILDAARELERIRSERARLKLEYGDHEAFTDH